MVRTRTHVLCQASLIEIVIPANWATLRFVSCMGRRNESGDDRMERLRPKNNRAEVTPTA